MPVVLISGRFLLMLFYFVPFFHFCHSEAFHLFLLSFNLLWFTPWLEHLEYPAMYTNIKTVNLHQLNISRTVTLELW